MDTEKRHTGACQPEVGRGCAFCDCGSESEARLCDGCFKLHETPWLDEYPVNVPTDIVEVRFKNTRRSFYQNVNKLPLKRGDIVAVEASPGHDIGIVSLTGDLVARQMRRTGFNPFNGEYRKIYRKAKPYDIERWQEAIALEHETMIRSRQIAADMGLNMKIGDVEYQGDKIKAIFYYIADERVDFRELIKVFAERFHIRIEMKQIGARQEAGRIGGIGACGRELCCASWISNFSSVTTNSARMQEISLNPQKLAGQCSKLKCCLAYEYDTYVDARKEFPRLREPLQALDGEYYLVKTDILAGTMSFSSSKDTMTNVVTLPVARVKEIIALNRAGKKVDQLSAEQPQREKFEEPTYRSEEGSITRFDGNGSKRKGRNRRRGDRAEERENRNNNGARNESAAEASAVSESRKDEKQENAANRSERREKRDRRERNNRNGQGEGRESRGERNNGQGEPHNPRNSDRNGPRNGQSTQKNEQRTERGNTSGEQNGERGNGQGSRSEQRGERRSERSRSENRPGQNGSETDPTPTHSQSPGEEGQNGARRRPRGRGGRNRREGNRREGGNGETAQPEPPKKEQ
ncbi:regulatory iron-sulfur-containing complex subunit RicT [Alistipes putredinis]|uniref:regulatory iron-sulfur-containing complex subunit RicT n=1 Tax=Alistipes putredinis TaxID=28117 RepID=UPI003A84696D